MTRNCDTILGSPRFNLLKKFVENIASGKFIEDNMHEVEDCRIDCNFVEKAAKEVLELDEKMTREVQRGNNKDKARSDKTCDKSKSKCSTKRNVRKSRSGPSLFSDSRG